MTRRFQIRRQETLMWRALQVEPTGEEVDLTFRSRRLA
jgi:hypothetical protein